MSKKTSLKRETFAVDAVPGGSTVIAVSVQMSSYVQNTKHVLWLIDTTHYNDYCIFFFGMLEPLLLYVLQLCYQAD